jgi:2-methylaconitate isomerase
MPLHSLRAVFMRGGTSRALMFHRRDLPAQQQAWAPIFLAAMGSPDPHGRQLDGMGGGISSLSKVCVIGPPTHPEADVDYTFAQIGVDTATVDYGGNCGNMSSAVGPFAIDEGLVSAPADGPVSVRIHNTNTRKLIVARFEVEAGRAAVRGPLVIDGVAGTGAPIRLEFRDLAGARTGSLLPTGKPQQSLSLPQGRAVRASLVDAANPCVFVHATELGLGGNELPDDIDANRALMADLEALRRQASLLMGLSADPEAAAVSRSVPFIGLVAAPRSWRTQSGDARRADAADIAVRMLSSGNAHRAIPITSALCVAVACRTPGTLPAQLCSSAAGPLRIAHAAGTILVEAEPDAGTGRVRHASVYRTARRLFQGDVLYPEPAGECRDQD